MRPSEMQRAAYIGDRLLAAALAIRCGQSKHLTTARKIDNLAHYCLSNELLAEYVEEPTKPRGSWNNEQWWAATRVEAAAHLEYERAGMDAMEPMVAELLSRRPDCT